MSNKTNRFTDKITFDSKTKVLRDNGLSKAISTEMKTKFTDSELSISNEVNTYFNTVSADAFKAITTEMITVLNKDGCELSSLSMDVSTDYGDLEVAINRPENGFTKDNIATATGLGIKHTLDTQTYQSIYDNLESTFKD